MIDKIAEEATGCAAHGSGIQFWNAGGKLTVKQAQAEMYLEEQELAVPNAGAGSYRDVFGALGFDKVEVYDWTSSAGDWTFGVRNASGTWFVATQENRFPYRGFRYSVNFEEGFDSFETLCEVLKNY